MFEDTEVVKFAELIVDRDYLSAIFQNERFLSSYDILVGIARLAETEPADRSQSPNFLTRGKALNYLVEIGILEKQPEGYRLV